MPTQDKLLLLNKVEETLKPRMFANLMEEAVTEIQEHLDDFDVTHISKETTGVEDLLDTIIAAKRVSGRSDKTLVRYQYIIQRFLKQVGISTREVTPAHVRAYFAEELARGVSESTVDGIRETLNAYFGWLKNEGLIPRNPVSGIESIKYQKKERLALSPSEIELLKRSCKSVRDNAIVSFLLATGCRISEVTGLNRDDVDLNEGECIVLGKGNKERTVFLDDVAVLMLREYLLTRNDSNEALFVGKGGKRLQPGGVRAMLKQLEKSANVENVHPHRFRRTAVTRLLNRGMPIQEVAILAGHEKVDTTMKDFAASKARMKSSYRMYST